MGLEMPVFEKRRFQHGAVDSNGFEALFPDDEAAYRAAFAALYGWVCCMGVWEGS